MIDFDKLRSMGRAALWIELAKHPMKYGVWMLVCFIGFVGLMAVIAINSALYTPEGGTILDGFRLAYLNYGGERLTTTIDLASYTLWVVMTIVLGVAVLLSFIHTLRLNNKEKAEWKAAKAKAAE